MLKQRILTALALLAVLLPALFYPRPAPFLLITLMLMGAASWEWARLNQASPVQSMAMAALCVAMCAGLWHVGALDLDLTWAWTLATGCWVGLVAWSFHRGVHGWTGYARWIRWAVGLLLLCCAWLAMARARVLGINFLLSILVLVWVADVAAYFFGRALGGKFFSVKLAPSISPGKTWEGAGGGLIGVLLLSFFWRWLDGVAGLQPPSLYSLLSLHRLWIGLLALVFLVMMSVVGDLFESLVKRSAGVKDSSGLLPGHGGVLDRIDALLPALPVGMMLHAWLG